MKNLEMTQRQKRIFIFLAVIALALFLFVWFVYIPAKAYRDKLKNEYNSIQKQIVEMRRSIGEGKSLEQAISFFKDRLAYFDKRFPSREEVVLREMPALAGKCGVEISSIRPSKKAVIQAIEGASLEVRDYTIQEMPISVDLKSSYKKLGEFLKALRNDFPAFVRVDKIQMSRAGDKDSNLLDVSLSLDTYFLSPKEA